MQLQAGSFGKGGFLYRHHTHYVPAYRQRRLGVSFDTVFDPADEQMEAKIQKITGLVQSRDGDLLLASTRAMAHELMDTSIE